MKNIRYLLFLALSLPYTASAAIYSIQDLIDESLNIFNLLIGVVFSFALVVFFWGLAKFILNSADEKAQTDGRRLMIWGVVALFIMSSIWGIITFLRDAFGVTDVDLGL